MSGHSKWATIKHKKGAADAKRGQMFTKLGRVITVAARKGGGDPGSNPSLRLAIEKARSYNMPNDNVKRAIERAVGGGDEGAVLEESTYEGYGPEGVAVLVKVLTDNRNRAASEVRNAFTKHGGSLGESGSAAYVFGSDPENPMFTVPVTDRDRARQVLALVEALDELEDVQEVHANFDIPDELISSF